MKNITVFYIIFTLLSIGTSCTKKDKEVVYPVNSNLPASGTGKINFNGTSISTSSLSISGNVITVVAGDKEISLSFSDATFAPNTYTTKSSLSTTTDVKVEIMDKTNNEVYLVEDNSILMISSQDIPNTTLQIISITLVSSMANPTVNTTSGSINVDFTVIK